MAGWILRVVTVTHGARYLRDSSYVPQRHVAERLPEHTDVHRAQFVPLPARGFSGAPCGSAARPSADGTAWCWLLIDLRAYIERWGSNPLGRGARMGTGAKDGARGRGPQDYLFNKGRA